MSRYVNRRTLLATVLLIVLGMFLPPLVNVSRFRPRVAGALSRALGRTVTVGDVRLRLIPRPGLDLKQVVVQDDPAFSAEPLLNASDVSASLRLASLWRGRLEIASLSFSYPSLNLVRARNGHWNLESLLERARQIPTAPTTKLSPESRPRFPYIEAKGGRINLKIGQEKKVYALSDANFALSLPSENRWQLRLSARPVRTDTNLSDTGTIRVSGTVQRGATLSDTPLDLRVVLEGAQLGQLTKLIYGRDRGWRGTVRLSALLRGTPAALSITSDSWIDDFRRYDIATRGSLRLAAHCSAGFSTTTQQLTGVACKSPADSGMIEVAGSVDGVLPPRSYALKVNIEELPATSLMALALRMKKDLPDDLQAAGTVSAHFDLQSLGTARQWSGKGSILGLLFNSRLMKSPLEFGKLPFTLGITTPPVRHAASAAAATALRFPSFSLDLGGPSPARVQAWFAHDAYSIGLQGDVLLDRLLELAHAFGVHAPQATVKGSAKADLSVAGNWSGFAAPLVTGNLQVRSATSVIPGVAEPLQVSNAAIHLAPDAVAVYDLAGRFSGTHLGFTGSVHVPRLCSEPPCAITFQLSADQLSTDELNRLLNPRAQKRPWYELIGSNQRRSPLLPNVSAVGKLSVSRLEVKTLTASRASGDVHLQGGVLTVAKLRAQVLGGSTSGELRADFTGAAPAYTIRGNLQHASVASIAALTRDAWATGRVGGDYSITATGWNVDELRDSAAGSASFDWREGNLAHLVLDDTRAPLKIRHYQGEAALADGEITFKPGKMETTSGIYVVSGTASLERELGLRLTRGKTDAYEVTGTVENPRIKRALLPTTQAAAMKP